MAQAEKMKLTSLDIAEEKREQLKQLLEQLLPEAVNQSGIDFDQLKRALGEWIEPGKERFGLQWPGKAECMKIVQQPSVATLKPNRKESVNFDDTENLFIEGDNLEVLKLLQKSYFGKIKMIYIDPPYNTGNEFIYPDKFAETLDTYLEYTGQKDNEGRKFSTNTDSAGRYHSRWLNMMYPRLYLAKNLLCEDGSIFISIDDYEIHNLRALCNEIFGEENFLAQITWEKTRKNDARFFSAGHEYILVYAKNEALLRERNVYWREEKAGADDIFKEYERLHALHGSNFTLIERHLKAFYDELPSEHAAKKHSRYNRVDEKGVWRDDNMSWPGGNGPTYDVLHPKTGKPCKVPPGGWRFSTPEKMQEMIDAGIVVFREDHSEPPIRKTYLVRKAGKNDDSEENIGKQVMGTYIYRSALQATKTLKDLFGANVFENPKDHEIIGRLISYTTKPDDIILDFFAGSATTAHSVVEINRAESSKRKFICVQLPEKIDEKSEAYKLGYKTISELSADRIRRVMNKITADIKGQLDLGDNDALDLGFKTLKLDSSNFKVWEGSVEQLESLEKQLSLHVDHIAKSSTSEDILYELLLKAGFSLTTKVEKQKIAGKEVFSIEEGAMLICLEKELTQQVIDAMAEAAPLQVICLDEGFNGNDQLKANAVQTFKARAQADESEIVFRTV
jgi:adenine-specific DNA-methyltransferase